MAQKASNLRVFFVGPGIKFTDYPRIAAICHIAIEVDGTRFRSVKNKFIGNHGEWMQLSEIHTYLEKMEALHNGTESYT